jgi:hypothetical protein
MTNRLLVLPAMAFVLACSTTTVAPPAGMEALAPAKGAEALVARFFPGLEGPVYLLSKADDGPILGLLGDPKRPGNTVLVGASQERSWSEQVPLEGAHRVVTRVTPVSAAIGDVRKDGLADILFVLEIESRPKEGQGKQVRRAAYLYALGKEARLVWYGSLFVAGKDELPCGGGELDYQSKPAFLMDEEGQLVEISGSFDQVRKRCSGGEGCEAGQRTCTGGRDSGKWSLRFDEELHTYKQEGATEVVLRIPDVTL